MSKEEIEVHHRLGAVVALNMCTEQLEAVATIYNEQAVRHPNKPIRAKGKYRYNKCRKAIEANTGVINDIYSDLIANSEGKEFVDEAVLHHMDLFYDLIALELKDQQRVRGLISKLKKAA